MHLVVGIAKALIYHMKGKNNVKHLTVRFADVKSSRPLAELTNNDIQVHKHTGGCYPYNKNQQDTLLTLSLFQ